jgi:hypothetical protein
MPAYVSTLFLAVYSLPNVLPVISSRVFFNFDLITKKEVCKGSGTARYLITV